MANLVCGGALCTCMFGAAPSTLIVTPENRTVSAMPFATVMDYVPFKNIMPFGMCSCMANPMVASATAAALGVLTPMPCIPVPAAPWTPGSPKVLIGNKPALTNTSRLMCSYGGVIQISNPGNLTVQTS